LASATVALASFVPTIPAAELMSALTIELSVICAEPTGEVIVIPLMRCAP
jgi:hypothetical protein